MDPLMGVLVMDVVLLHSTVENAELGVVADLAVVISGRIIGIQGLGRLGSSDHVALRVAGIRGNVHHHGGFAHSPRTQEVFFIFALGAVPHGTYTQPVGDDLRSNSANTVVDRESIN